MKKLLLMIFILCMFFGFSNAIDWDIPNKFQYFTRTERGADETRRYTEQPQYQSMIKYQENKTAEMEKLKNTDFEKYLEMQEENYRFEVANQYLVENFGENFEVDFVNNFHSGNELRQTEKIKNNKTEIIIHHTASSYKNLTGKQSVLDYLQKTYQFHAWTRGWGDIGYNFLIDPFGNIYEGRAGGEGVIGTHVARNNAPSIGIALMGNFDEEQVTEEQKKSLIGLTTLLAQKYNINPESKTFYHRTNSEYPYLESTENYSIAGHRDAGHTSCPGENLYKLLPEIRKQVIQNLTINNFVKDNNKEIFIPEIFYSSDKKLSVKLDLGYQEIEKCGMNNIDLKTTKCEIGEKNTLNIEIEKQKYFASGIKTIVVKGDGSEKKIKLLILWQEDLDKFIYNKKQKYFKKEISSKTPEQKISHQITLSEAKDLVKKEINVLLNELSSKYKERSLECDGYCTFILEGGKVKNKVIVGSTGTVMVSGQNMFLKIMGKTIEVEQISVKNTEDIITVNNYDRKSYAGIPWNSFRGSLIFTKDFLPKSETKQFVVINSLKFDDYLKGVVETNDTESFEKNKTMVIIAKSYALFYMHPQNQHPDINPNSQYNAVDDPEIFQKYVGQGLEKTLTKRPQALSELQNKIAIYNDFVPILPYFHCSPGFTLSAQEKRGRTDTPYLKSRLDMNSCGKMDGHGVGLSGLGAERRAKKGRNYIQILNYYYDNLEIVNL